MAKRTPAVGDQVFLAEGGEEVGAVRDVGAGGTALTIWVENAGEFAVPAGAIRAVHDGKVLLDESQLDQRLRDAIAHAHDREEPGA